MRKVLLYLATTSFLLLSLSCERRELSGTNSPMVTPTPSPIISWPTDPDDFLADNEPLRVAYKKFESTEKYRLAQPSDRNLTPAARLRASMNSEHQVFPFLEWWGALGYRGFPGKHFLVAIVVDPSRSDANRYGLVVIAAAEGPNYKTYWVKREEDMESYLISPASGGVYLECFQRDGGKQDKQLAWDRKSHQFRLI